MTTPHMPPPHSPDGDRFIQIGEASTGFLEEHLKTILMVIAVIVAFSLGGVMMKRSQENSRIEAQDGLAAIIAIYPADGSPVPTATIRGAVEKYNAFIAGDPAGVAPYLAQLNLGMAQEELGDVAAAAAAYRAAAAGPSVIAGAAEMRLGYLLMTGDDKKSAGDAFGRVIGNHPGMAPQAALETARMAELAGAKDVALEQYRQVALSFANTPQASEAQARIRALGGEPATDAAKTDTAGHTAPAKPMDAAETDAGHTAPTE